MKEAMTGLGRAVVIILILLVVMNIAKGFMRDPNKKEEVIINPSIVDDEDKDDDKKKNQDFDNDYDYESIYDKYNFKTLEGFYGNDFKKLYYDKADFTNEYYLYLSVINQTRNNYIFVCNNDFSIKESDVNNKIKELFGNVNYTPTSYTSSDKSFSITYNEKSKNYTIKTSKCAGILPYTNYIETKYLGGIHKDNTIEIYENAYYVSYVKKDGQYREVLHKDVTEYSSEALSQGENSFAKYKLIFEIVNNSIVFRKVESV
jgi:hypothetical protein